MLHLLQLLLSQGSPTMAAPVVYYTDGTRQRERDLSYSNSVLFIFGAIGGAESDTKHSAAGASSGGNSHLLNPPRPDLILLHQHSLYSFFHDA